MQENRALLGRSRVLDQIRSATTVYSLDLYISIHQRLDFVK